jgi:DNA-binding MarR family transcriptional regulator
MNQKPEHETISFLLGQICREQRGLANEELTKVGLYAGQEMFLWQLWQQDGLAQSQLVEQMCVQPPTISKMLDRMEKSGLVVRRPDPEDSRISRVYLTEQGRNLEKSVCGVWAHLEERVSQRLSVEERLLLRRLLLQVYQNLDRNLSVTA